MIFININEILQKQYPNIHFSKQDINTIDKEWSLRCLANSEKYEEINFKYDGYKIKTIQHDEFGPEPVKVFAISLKGERLN